MNGTGLSVWAVCGWPVTGSVIISQLPWSAVISMAMPAFWQACQSRPTHSSTTFTAFTAASRMPVWPTMSGLAKLTSTKPYCPVPSAGRACR